MKANEDGEETLPPCMSKPPVNDSAVQEDCDGGSVKEPDQEVTRNADDTEEAPKDFFGNVIKFLSLISSSGKTRGVQRENWFSYRKKTLNAMNTT